ncbi:MAG TPA: rhodanese-like domain-containing protein [Acidobacteriota bacterium]|nr:rhodanese-like domain-containing protein [Acidobacteriota bacterium]
MKTKSFVFLMLFLSCATIIGGFPTASAKEDIVLPQIPRITAEELRQMIDKGADLVVIDTRDSGSYEAGHIKGAINIYYDPTSDPTERQMMLMALPMDKLLVTYCDCTDDANSAKMADELYKLGYDRDKVKALAGGSLKWVELKYPMIPKQ